MGCSISIATALPLWETPASATSFEPPSAESIPRAEAGDMDPDATGSWAHPSTPLATSSAVEQAPPRC